MSWTVQEEPRNDAMALEKLLSRVVDEEEDYAPSPEKKSTSDSMNSPFHHLKTSFISPAPLTPSELLVTPVKDPLESFNSWVRTQTPCSASRGGTPTPAGALGELTPGQHHQRGLAGPGVGAGPAVAGGGAPGVGVSRPLHFGTPQKFGGAPMDPTMLAMHGSAGAAAGGAGGAGVMLPPMGATPLSQRSLETIYETRRQLLTQMEELALQEMELRSSPTAERFHHTPVMDGMVPSPMSAHGFGSTPQSPTMQITAENIRGRVYETAKDQQGCRYLQRWLDSSYDAETAQVIMAEIVPHVPELMTDQYANFLVQKLFDLMPLDIRYNVAQVAAPHMTSIALTPHGTFSVQKLIETIATREEMEIVRESLSHDVNMLVKNVHGNHVIQKVLQRFEHPDKQFIYDAVMEDCTGIATNKQGCCVLQRCLEFGSPQQRQVLVRCILDCAIPIVQDPFGNYVVQYVLEAHDVAVNDMLAKMYLPQLLRLSMNKFSSNVMEKVLRGCSVSYRDEYVTAMKEPNLLSRMIQDDYGNYVVQTALTVSTNSNAEGLVSAIRPLMPLIRNAPYAKKLEAKMDQVLKKRTGAGFGAGHHSMGGGGGGAGGHHHRQHQQQFNPYGGAGGGAKGFDGGHTFHSPVHQHHHHHHHHHQRQQQQQQEMVHHGPAHTPQRGGGFPRPFRPNAAPWTPPNQPVMAQQQ